MQNNVKKIAFHAKSCANHILPISQVCKNYESTANSIVGLHIISSTDTNKNNFSSLCYCLSEPPNIISQFKNLLLSCFHFS